MSTHSTYRSFIPLPGSYNSFGYNARKNKEEPTTLLRILQFNILADGLSGLRDDLGHYNRIDRQFVLWEYRRDRLLHEITRYNPDIITLQEVDHYHDFFLEKLREKGYIGYFAPKPTSGCLDVSNNADGCAIFVKSSKFNVISSEAKTLALSIAELNDAGELSEDDETIKTQNQVALLVICTLKQEKINSTNYDDFEKLYERPPPPAIIIATTQLKSSKTATGERYRKKEVSKILTWLQNIYVTLIKTRMSKTPPVVIFSGDFNAVPDNNNNEYEPLTYQSIKKHPFGLRSVYNDDIPLSPVKLSNDTLYTTWKSRNKNNQGEKIFKKCVDYIFYLPFKASTLKRNSNSNSDNSNIIENGPLMASKPSIVISSTKQLIISLLLRISVYFFLAVLPLTSIISPTIANEEKVYVIFTAVFGLILFEATSEGSIFRPQIGANVQTDVDSSFNIKSIEDLKLITERPETLLVSLSQKISPLPQYGRPGLQAVQALDVLSYDQIGETCLPSKEYSSDHLAICADLEVIW
eukprot:gene11923-15955_t